MVDLAKPGIPWRRYSFIFLGVLLISSVLVYVGIPYYRKWEPVRLAARAKEYVEKGDYQSAILTARRGIKIDPRSLECCKILTRVAEELDSFEAVALRQRAVALQPKSSEALLDLAETAMRFGELIVAGEALTKVNDDERQNSRYQADLGGVAAGLNQLDLALEAYGKALKMDPANTDFQFRYAAIQLRRDKSEDRQAGQKTLRGLEKDERLRAAALRLLLNDASAHGELGEALALGRDLEADPHCTFNDKMILLNLRQTAKTPDVSTFFDSLKTAAFKDGRAMAALLLWMNRNGKAAEGLEWARQAPPNLSSTAEVNAALALCFQTIKDWAGLEAFAADADWQHLDYLRFALLAQAAREQGKKEESVTDWQSAADLALSQPRRAMGLVRLAMGWGWIHEAQDLLSRVTIPSQDAKVALATLYHQFAQTRDTRGLLQASEKLMRFNPEDDKFKNNFAMYSLLLKRNITDASVIAKELNERHASDPAYISTYALSLFANADFENALKVMNTMTPAQLEIPEMAAYYAVILSANGQNDEALKFFELAKRGKFLPEEEELIERYRP